MSRAAEVSLKWADGTYLFRLRIGQLRELQEKCDAGPLALLRRFEQESYRIDDLRETIRLGLIGGGLPPLEAMKLVERYVDDRPLAENSGHARIVLMAAVIGMPDQEKSPGKRRAAKKTQTPAV